MTNRIGTQAVWYVDRLQINVHVLDARPRYGTMDYLCEPVSGSGHRWINEGRLEFSTEERGTS